MNNSAKITFGMLCVTALLSAVSSHAQTIFTDDFEGGLGQWTGKNGGAHHAMTVPDPLSSGHGNVLSFTGLNGGGDIYSTATLSFNGPVQISFDYLGVPSYYGTPDNLGGFFGIAYSLDPFYLGADHFWLAGSELGFGNDIELVDDGAWHHYEIALDGTVSGSFRLMIEDYDGSGGIAGDALFDNMIVTVPEPSSAALGFLGLAFSLVVSKARCHRRT